MPYLLEDKTCPACPGSHDFIVEPEPATTTGPPDQYRFTCPGSGQEGTIAVEDDEWGRPVGLPPRGAVLARKFPPGR